MKKLMQWMMAAILICGATVFTSCNNDDNPVKPTANLSEKIIGKWITSEFNGQPQATDNKVVFNFVSDTKAFLSASFFDHPELSDLWNVQTEYAVVISGNKVTLTNKIDEHQTIIIVFDVNSITSKEIQTVMKNALIVDGQEISSPEMPINFTKVTRDYDEAILGLWECTGLKGGETFNDANARLEFFEDGTYNYFRKNDAGEWEVVTTREFQEYFVDGTLLATLWKNTDEDELREWWEIKSLKGDKMQWKSLRANEDGTTFEQIMDWERVEE